MPEINLLQDTTSEDKKKKSQEAPKVEYTQPSAEPKDKSSEPKLKRGPTFGFLGKLFSKKPKPEPVQPSPSKNLTPEDVSIPKQPISPPVQPETPEPQPDIWKANRAKKEVNSRVLEERVLKKAKPAKPVKEPIAPGVPSQSFLDVNLMPDDLIQSLEPKRKLITYGIVTIASVALIVLGYFGLSYYEKSIYRKVEDVSKNIQQVEDSIKNLRDKQKSAILLKAQTDEVKDILDNHVHWSNFFEMLERFTLSEVVYERFAGTFSRGTNSTFSLSARGANFQSISRQIMAFREEAKGFITNVEANTGEWVTTDEDSGQGYVSFTMLITVSEDVFYKQLAVTKEGE
ncbi:MAG: hypothetical protein PHI73_04785 [Patescibacteria group bacterium]|nr:hypothetical protein [Patescibacteria group bacterium]